MSWPRPLDLQHLMIATRAALAKMTAIRDSIIRRHQRQPTGQIIAASASLTRYWEANQVGGLWCC